MTSPHQPRPAAESSAAPPAVAPGDPGSTLRQRSGGEIARVVAVAILTAVGVLAGLYLLWQLRQIVEWAVLGTFAAVALNPAVDWVGRKLPRALAVLLVYLLVLLVLAVIAGVLVPPLLGQGQALVGFISDTLREPRGALQLVQRFADRYGLGGYLAAARSRLGSALPQLGSAAAPLLAVTRGVITGVTAVLSILLIAFFLLLDGRKFVDGALRLLAPERGPHARELLRQSAGAVSGYLIGNFSISLIAGIATFITLLILRVPAAAPLALVVAVLDLIPLVGATLGAAVVTIVGFFVSPLTGIILIIYFLVYQQIENNVLQPVVYGRSVRLHPLAVFIAVLVGAELMGILGALLAIPVAEIIRILAADWFARRQPQHGDDGAAA